MMSTIIYSDPACRLMSFNVTYFPVVDIVARLTAGETRESVVCGDQFMHFTPENWLLAPKFQNQYASVLSSPLHTFYNYCKCIWKNMSETETESGKRQMRAEFMFGEQTSHNSRPHWQIVLKVKRLCCVLSLISIYVSKLPLRSICARDLTH